MPTGEDYRFLYVMLYNMGRGYHVGKENETRTMQQLLLEEEYEYFKDNQPCRTTVEINSLPTPIAIELKCIATI